MPHHEWRDAMRGAARASARHEPSAVAAAARPSHREPRRRGAYLPTHVSQNSTKLGSSRL